MPDGEVDGQTGKLILLVSIILLVFVIIVGGVFFWFAQQRRNNQPPPPQNTNQQSPPPQNTNQQPAPSGGTGSRPPQSQQPPPVSPSSTGQRTVAQQQRVDSFITDGRDFTLGNTREEIIANLGQPKKETIANIKNRHTPSQTDKTDTLEYDGLTVEIYQVTAGNQQLLDSVTITNAQYPVKYALDIGTTGTHVTEVLGPPDERNGNVSIYQDEQGLNRVLFTIGENRVNRIEWDYYVD